MGKLKLKEKVGEGGFGEVYLLETQPGEPEKVIKLFHQKKSRSEDYAKQEIDMLVEIGKENIPHVVRYFSYEKKISFKGKKWNGVVMEYIDGNELYDLLKCLQKTNSTIPPHLLLYYMYQAFEALSALHERNIVHRDIKPANILYDAEKLTIIDLGLSCFTKLNDKINKNLECRDSIQGTTKYISPEIMEWEHQNDLNILKSADVWAMGVTFYELANTRRAFPNFRLYPESQKHLRTKKYEEFEHPHSNYRNYDEPEISKFINLIITKSMRMNYKYRPTAKTIFNNIKSFLKENKL